MSLKNSGWKLRDHGPRAAGGRSGISTATERPRSASAEKRNKARCFVCDPRALSTIDLVQQVLGSSVIEAVQWLDDRFPGSPRIVKGKHIVKRRAQEEIGTRIGVDSLWTDLRRSAFLGATMTPAEQCVLSALVELANPTTGEARLSYR